MSSGKVAGGLLRGRWSSSPSVVEAMPAATADRWAAEGLVPFCPEAEFHRALVGRLAAPESSLLFHNSTAQPMPRFLLFLPAPAFRSDISSPPPLCYTIHKIRGSVNTNNSTGFFPKFLPPGVPRVPNTPGDAILHKNSRTNR